MVVAWSLLLLNRFVAWLTMPLRVVFVVVVVSVPWKVKVCTSPILLKKGTIVSRTKRRSLETTACTVMNVPSESTTITGCCAAAKSPTTGITLITKGVCEVSETNACWPLNERDLGGLEDVRPLVGLGGIDEEVGLDVAEDREAHAWRRQRWRRSRRTAAPPGHSCPA